MPASKTGLTARTAHRTCRAGLLLGSALVLVLAHGAAAAGQRQRSAQPAPSAAQRLVSTLIEEISRSPHSGDRLAAAAVSVSPAFAGDIARAATIGRMLAGNSGAPAAGAPAAATPSFAPPGPPPPTGLLPTVAPTFPYLTDNGTVTATARLDLPWMAARPVLDTSFSLAQRQEFAANWGNLAIGQATALNATTRPLDGAPLPGKGLIGRGVTVAVLDTGIDATFNATGTGFSSVHPEFAGRLDLRSRNTNDDGRGPLAIGDDSGGHGTHVAGTIAAAMDGTGMLGVAPGARLVAMRALPGGVDEAIRQVTAMPDVRIINGSYGPEIAPGSTIWKTGDLSDEWLAVRGALAAGKVLVFSNGNNGEDSPIQAAHPAGGALFPYISRANAHSGVYDDGGRNYDFSEANSPRLPGRIVAVANLGIDLKISADSNRCGVAASWCISAPGGGVGSSQPNANEILSTFPRGPGTGTFTAPGGATYAYMTGTSMAAPHVSGALAVLMEAYPTYSAAEIVRLMFATAEDLGAPGVDAVYGHGLVRIDRALTGAPALGPADSRTTTVAAGGTELWTAPVATAGTLTIDNAAPSGGHRPSRPSHSYGELQIAGVAQFGTVDIRNGQLSVDGTLVAPSITVGVNGQLSGFGDVIGNVAVHGVLKPGSSPGEMVIVGNVAMGPTGIFQVDIDGRADTGGPGSYDTLFVLGPGHAFTAGGTFSARLRGIEAGASNSYVPTIGSRFAVVRAEAGARIAGHFSGIDIEADATGATGLPLNARLDVLYYPTSIVAAVTPASFAGLPSAGIALNTHGLALAVALDRARPAPAAPMTNAELHVFDLVYGLPAGRLSDALDAMSGRGYGGQTAGSLQSVLGFASMLQQRRDGLRSGSADAIFTPTFGAASNGRFEASAGLPAGALAYADPDDGAARARAAGWSVWGQAFGNGGAVKADSGAGWSNTGGGFVFGIDRPVTPALTVGFAGFYTATRTRGDNFVGTSSSLAGALYGALSLGRVEIDAVVGGSWTEMSSTRNFSIGDTALAARGATRGFGLLATTEIGYRFQMPTHFGEAFVKPFAGIAYADVNRAAFTETGAGGFNLTVMADRPARALAQIGLSTGLAIRGEHGLVWRPEFKLAWGHDFKDPSPPVSAAILGQTFTVRDTVLGRNAALVGLQLGVSHSDWLQIYAGYDGEFRHGEMTHQGRIGARLRW